MLEQAAVVGNRAVKEGEPMKRRDWNLGRRLAALGAAGVLALSLAGDRGRAATVPATVYGQDPLEVLELKVRPNVVVVLDSSGSMTNNPPETFNTNSGDHPRSKLWQAKQVLKTVFQNNQEKVSFQFGTYTQYNISFNNQGASTRGNRFQYVTSAMPATELTVQGAAGDTFGRGIQSWQIIQAAWNRLYFGEQGGVICYATVPGAPRFYNSGAALAADLQAGMNAPTCTAGSRANTYTVSYNATTGVFTFTRASGTRTFNIRWADTPGSIRGALGRRTTGNTTLGTGAVSSGSPYRLLYRTTGTGTSGGELNTRWTFTETIGGTSTTYYQLAAGRLWNGEVVRVQSDGTVCGMTFPTAAEETSPPTLTLQEVAAGCGADVPSSTAVFSFGGGDFSGNNVSCRGFRSKSSLVPCDLQSPPAPTQLTQMLPYIEGELPFAATGEPQDLTTNDATGAPGGANYGVPDGQPDYVETQDGSWATSFIAVAPSAKADGWTPIANSLIDIKGAADASNACLTNAAPAAGKLDPLTGTGNVGACLQRGFSRLWNQGQTGTTSMAGPGPWQLDPIKNHRDPKEKTIVLFVTDGDDTCGARGNDGSGTTDDNARRAAYYAERLYQPLDATEPASSVQTYVIGYGGAFTAGEPYRLNWIAWGGSGLGQGTTGQPDITTTGDRWTEVDTSIKTKRAQCTTCVDAFVAPDASTLATQLQAIIDQGASDGDFNAQQSITETVFEYVDQVPTKTWDARMPLNRYGGRTPLRFVSSFTLPGFKGQLRAYQNDGLGNSIQKWSAGDKLANLVSAGMITCNNTTAGGVLGECVMAQLHGGATDASILSSSARIKRRVYTTSRNGVYTFSPASLMAGTSPERVSLWPPAPGVLPAGTDYSNAGTFDVAMGLPPDTPTGFPPFSTKDPLCDPAKPDLPKKSYDQCWLDALQTQFKVCLGSNLPAACTSASVNTKMRAARREARDIAIAFMAGAATVPETTGLKRTSAAVGSSPTGSLLFRARSWVLGDSEMATAAVVTQPSRNVPAVFPDEYALFRDGPRNAAGKNPDTGGTQVRQGFGLSSPDDDQTVGNEQPDGRTALKPVMTVVYAPSNDMLHAFRAGPCFSPTTAPASCVGSSVSESGGEELWGFVPYDQLNAVYLRAANEPQGRANHVFMIARGIRFADVFVPNLDGSGNPTPMSGVTVGGLTSGDDPRLGTMSGVWRRLVYFGRGIGGKYVTALDVSAPGPYTAQALDTTPPVPLWSRGNPDTADGLQSGTNNGTPAERTVYATMGETWSMPTVTLVNKDNASPIYRTARRPSGINFAIFMGSGYGNAGEGTTHYALDALSGDVIAAVDVEAAAASYGLNRSGLPYRNALVANSVSNNPSAAGGKVTQNPHPWTNYSTRVYIGDLYGRLWKFLTDRPDVAIPAADLGADQPVGVAVALIPSTTQPLIFVTSGAENRQEGPFRNFTFEDRGTDFDIAVAGSTTDDGVTTFAPVFKLFADDFDQGDPEAECGYRSEAMFRGTIQPTGSFACTVEMEGSNCSSWGEVVFFGGTRLSLPNTRFAPVTPLACSQGEYPCRSQFDTILYAYGARSGLAAYDLNAAGDDAYRIFRDSRIAAISMQADPDPGRGGSSFTADEGLMKGTPKPPPPPGIPPTVSTASANVVFRREPGQPAPAVRYGSTVCQ